MDRSVLHIQYRSVYLNSKSRDDDAFMLFKNYLCSLSNYTIRNNEITLKTKAVVANSIIALSSKHMLYTSCLEINLIIDVIAKENSSYQKKRSFIMYQQDKSRLLIYLRQK